MSTSQPKTYLVQERLRVESIPVNPIRWLRRIFSITDEELRAKCGLDGYFFIRMIRALLIIFVPLMIIIVPILLPVNYSGNEFGNTYFVAGHNVTGDVSGLDTLSWQNIAPTQTRKYWAHLVCAILAVAWTCWRIYCEKVSFIEVRQQFLTAPEQRIKASARTVLVTNIPSEYRSKEALESLYDVFVDNDDHSRLTVWVNRDYKPLRTLAASRSKLRHALEKEELKILREVNKHSEGAPTEPEDNTLKSSESTATGNDGAALEHNVAEAFEADCRDDKQLWRQSLKSTPSITLIEDASGNWTPTASWKFWVSGNKKEVPKIAWLRSEIARLTVQIEDLLQKLDDDETFPRQNSAFVQFDRQMAAHMACSLVSHHKFGRMNPRYLGVAPHEIVWPNMGVTSLWRLVRTFIALFLFVVMLVLWGIVATFLGILSQLDTLRVSVPWLQWLKPCPTWVISLISGTLCPLHSIGRLASLLCSYSFAMDELKTNFARPGCLHSPGLVDSAYCTRTHAQARRACWSPYAEQA